LRELGVEAGYDLGFSNPVEALPTLVDEHRPDPAVVVSHGQRAFADFAHDTTAEPLRRRVRVPVLVVATG
jgi:hypothetical protein